MARTVTPLSDTKIKTSKPKTKDYTIQDGGGLFLQISKSDSKIWKFRFNFENKRPTITIGKYPAITLSRARELREQYKKDITNGINPINERQVKKEIIKDET